MHSQLTNGGTSSSGQIRCNLERRIRLAIHSDEMELGTGRPKIEHSLLEKVENLAHRMVCFAYLCIPPSAGDGLVLNISLENVQESHLGSSRTRFRF